MLGALKRLKNNNVEAKEANLNKEVTALYNAILDYGNFKQACKVFLEGIADYKNEAPISKIVKDKLKNELKRITLDYKRLKKEIDRNKLYKDLLARILPNLK